MKTLLIMTILFTNLAHSAINHVDSGSNIQAAKLNELIDKINELEQKVVPVGTVLSSLLPVSTFVAQNGDCWKLMDGSSIVGSELATLTASNNLPQAVTDGRFLRQAKAGRVAGSLEEDENKSHAHAIYGWQSAGSVQQPGYPTAGGVAGVSAGGGTAAYRYTGPSNGVSFLSIEGGTEVKPKNIAVNMFVKYKKQCTF